MKMDSNRLWAKSKSEGEAEHPSMLLPQHLKDVYAAAERVLDATGDDQLSALGLNPTEYRVRLRQCVLLAAAVHDLGKANDHFQGMLLRTESRRNKLQGLRHEWVTVLMLQVLRNWLLPEVGGSEIDFAIVEWAVAGHHPAHDHASPPRVCPGGAGVEIELYIAYSEFQDILRWLKVESSNLLTPKRQLVGNDNVFAELVGWSKRARQRYDQLSANDKKLVAAVKNCLIAADVAGSALPRELPNDPNRWNWITDSFNAVPLPGELQKIVIARAETFKERNEDRERFQGEVDASTALVTYVKAGCGS
jgi:CRISPR-associated endonuclease/helicase Cas3